MSELTLSIIKPDATKRNLTGKINAIFEENGLVIAAQKKVILSKHEAEQFYIEHKARPFYGELVDFMISGPVVLQVLKGENAVLKNRDLMGATNPKDARDGTIRKLFSLSVGENSVHGSDSLESAKREISFFFSQCEIVA